MTAIGAFPVYHNSPDEISLTSPLRRLCLWPLVLGPIVLQTLNIIDGYDLAGKNRFSMGVYHLTLEALKAAFADHDRYYGNLRGTDRINVISAIKSRTTLVA
jgi:gamma-glutamyltranspeptidase